MNDKLLSFLEREPFHRRTDCSNWNDVCLELNGDFYAEEIAI